MSDANTPAPVPGTPNPQPHKVNKTAGCIGLVVLFIVIGWIADMAGCDKEDNSPQNSAQQQILKEMGPDNPMAKRINSLNQNNAYGAGVTDGSRETMEVSVRMSWGRDDYQEKLADYRSTKSEAFDLLASQNKFDSTVFQQYKRGWDYGASTLSIK